MGVKALEKRPPVKKGVFKERGLARNPDQ